MKHLSSFAWGLLSIILTMPLAPAQVQAQAQAQAQAQTPKQSTTASTLTPAAASSWSALTEPQKVALAPLQPVWASISAIKKQKWLDISTGYHLLSPEGQSTLHFRMKEWASLTAKQRQEARTNFAQTHQLSAAEKQTSWQAYQALSPEEKQKLANANKASPVVGAAPVVKPIPKDKLISTPVPAAAVTNATPKRAIISPPPAANINSNTPASAVKP